VEVGRRERAFANYAAAFARCLPDELRVLAFCSPASFREPEIDDIWHPWCIARGTPLFFIAFIPRFFRACIGGVRRLFFARFGSFTGISGSDQSILGITPAGICLIEDGHMRTAYCHPDDAAHISWIVFDDAGAFNDEFRSRVRVLAALGSMLLAWFRTSFFAAFRDPDVAVVSALTVAWILNLQWVCLWAFGQRVEKHLERERPRLVFCVHEVWPWARVVWDILRRKAITGVTIQHASITRSKLWYFPQPVERDAGFPIPNIFAVFSQKERELLTPFFPSSTQFLLSCGPRFMHWKKQIMSEGPLPARGSVLFVTSVPWWDNEVVLDAARKICIGTTPSHPIIIRLHPGAAVPFQFREWLKKAHEQGMLRLSTTTLAEDIAAADVVVGMNSTALEEGAVMGRAVVVLHDDRFLSFAPDLGVHVSIAEFTNTFLWGVRNQDADRKKLMSEGRRALALDSPVVRLATL